jgi:hypothetical protein
MSFFLLSAALSAASAIPTPTLTDADVTKSIELIVKTLEERHDEDRCWDSANLSNGWLSKHRGGTTALTTLALLSAGHSSQAPHIQRALDYVWEVEGPSSYLLTLRTSIWALLPDAYKDRLEKDTKRLIKTMSLQVGGWGIDASRPTSLSKTSPLTREFGVLAFQAANRRGEKIPKKYWAAIANASLSSQHHDGGWSYAQNAKSGDPNSNMTVAGLNCLLGVDEVIGGELNETDSKILQGAIDRGLAWLDKNATTSNSGGTALMSYLYALERAAMSCGLAEIRGRDWYSEGARAAIKSHCGVRKAKGSTVNLSFALLFLSRGRAPLALCELVEQRGQVDPYRVAEIITKQVSELTEQNLSWQLVTKDESVHTWLAAPFLLVQNVHALPDDGAKCEEYLKKGGKIVMLATGKDLRLCTAFASSLCPDIQMIETQSEHWSHELIEEPKGVRLFVWNDGIRDQILIIQGNGEKLTRSKNSKLSKLFINLCCGSAELDSWPSRLHVSQLQTQLESFILAEHSGRWSAESSIFTACKSTPLTDIKNQSFVWVGGVDASEVNPKLIEDIINIASTGTTVLVESIGGQGHFASTVQHKLAEKTRVLVEPARGLQQFTGRRAWSIRNQRVLPTPLMASIGEGSVLFIDCDLRNALQGRTAWGVHGYSTQSANELVQSVLCQ